METIHCNKCFVTKGSNREFDVTNCGHMLCRECLQKGLPISAEYCLICQAKCRSIKVPENDAEDVKCLSDIEQYIRMGMKNLTFQNSQFTSLMEHQAGLENEMKKMKNELKYLERQNHKTKKMLQERNVEIQNMKARLTEVAARNSSYCTLNSTHNSMRDTSLLGSKRFGKSDRAPPTSVSPRRRNDRRY